MKKVKILLCTLLFMCLLVPYGWAMTTNFDALKITPKSEDICAIRVENSAGTVLWCVNQGGQSQTLAGTTGIERNLTLPLLGFMVVDSVASVSPTLIATPTAVYPVTVWAAANNRPGWTLTNNIVAIGWSSSNWSQVTATFRVPTDYSSGGGFRVAAYENASVGGWSPNAIGFTVYTNRNGRTPAYTNTVQSQAAVTLAGTTLTLSVVTLTPSGDTYFSALAAGDWVTLSIWRAWQTTPVAAKVGALIVTGVDFYYTGKY